MRCIPYEDLLSIPWDGYGNRDCVWLARTLLERGGFTIPDGALPTCYSDKPQALSSVDFSPWERVGTEAHHARRVGDIIYTRTKNEDHISTVVQDESPVLIVTTSEKRGVQALPVSRLSSEVVGVFRLKQTAAPDSTPGAAAKKDAPCTGLHRA